MPEILYVSLHDGNLRIPAQVSTEHFGNVATVAVQLNAQQLCIYPIHDAAQGGLLLKVRNAAGDRSVHIGDLLGQHGVTVTTLDRIEACWDGQQARLTCHIPFANDGAQQTA